MNIPCVIDAQIDQDDKVFQWFLLIQLLVKLSEEDLAELGYDC